MTAPADLVLTSDPGDIRKLLQARGVPARVQASPPAATARQGPLPATTRFQLRAYSSQKTS